MNEQWEEGMEGGRKERKEGSITGLVESCAFE